MAKKEAKQLGCNYMVKSGSHYSGCIGNCVEVLNSKRYGIMLNIELDSGNMWFNENELEEF